MHMIREIGIHSRLSRIRHIIMYKYKLTELKKKNKSI